jgi:flagellar biosynthesis/type III secretory pathway protein FliH
MEDFERYSKEASREIEEVKLSVEEGGQKALERALEVVEEMKAMGTAFEAEVKKFRRFRSDNEVQFGVVQHKIDLYDEIIKKLDEKVESKYEKRMDHLEEF